MSVQKIMSPVLIGWLGLMLCHLWIRSTSARYLDQVNNLHHSKLYATAFKNQKFNHSGRITKHCSKYTSESFQVRLLTYQIYSLISIFSGVFLKLYVLDIFTEVSMSWTLASSVGFAPIFLFYATEIIRESMKS
jgi:hypothetical protein